MNHQLSVFNYSVSNKIDDAVDIFIDGDIVDAPTQEILKSYFGDDTSISYKSFRDQVNNLDAKTYNVYINSGGGLVTDAMAIHDLLIEMQSKGKTVNTIGRGIVASAATYILMASKNPSMSSNSWVMIHNVSGFIWGDVNTVENYARSMRQFNDAANQFYQDKTGLSKTVVSNMMNTETWMNADDAKSKGFVKNISGEVSFSNIIKPELWQYQNTAVLNAYNSFTKNNNVHMDTKKITEAINNGFNSLLEKLGIKDKKDDETVKNAFTEFSENITNAITSVAKDSNVMGCCPAGGTKGQMLTKASGNDYDYNWEDDSASDKAKNTLASAVKNAVTDATKDALTKEDVKNEVKEGLKNVITKKDLEDFKETITNSVVEKMGGQSTENKKKGKTKGVKNRFEGADFGDFEDK